jgi:hypothetical protein
MTKAVTGKDVDFFPFLTSAAPFIFSIGKNVDFKTSNAITIARINA